MTEDITSVAYDNTLQYIGQWQPLKKKERTERNVIAVKTVKRFRTRHACFPSF